MATEGVPLQDPQHGPLFGHTTSVESRVWARGKQGQRGAVRWREAGSEAPWRHIGLQLHAHLDFIGVGTIAFDGAPRLEVEVGFVDQGVPGSPEDLDFSRLSSLGRGVVTAAPGDDAEFSFIVGSCRHRGFGPFRRGDHAFLAMRAHLRDEPAGFLLLCGDQVYCDHPVSKWLNLMPVVSGKLNKTPGSQQGYFEKYQGDFATEGFRAVMGSLPTYMILDDHEIRNNWAGFKYLDSFVEDGKTIAQWGPDTLLWGGTSYLAYQASHSPVVSNLVHGLSPGTPRPSSWTYRFSWGLADFMVLDVRSKRTDPHPKNPAAGIRMIDLQEEADLIAFLRADNETRLKFVVSPVNFAPDITDAGKQSTMDDTWRGYGEQRKRILAAISELPRPPVFIGGDLHLATVVRLMGGSADVPCILASALNWFMFGVQKTGGPITPFAGRVEYGPLTGAPGFSVERYDEAPEFQGNNFMRVEVKRDTVAVRLFEVVGGKPRERWSCRL